MQRIRMQHGERGLAEYRKIVEVASGGSRRMFVAGDLPSRFPSCSWAALIGSRSAVAPS